MKTTRTYAVLEISPSAHAEIKAKLLAAGYDHAIDGEMIDMHGIALKPADEPLATPVAGNYSARAIRRSAT